ncbi:MAG TPA: class I SAM-dependent methyltransferase [Vicinamibacterales bacterium]|nr:class I SAM-dependent methyltransferase [Vicinamibacterales bacterium]
MVASDVHGDADYQWQALRAAEPGHFWFRARRDLVVWTLATHFPNARTLLEVGCGTGYVLEGLQESRPALALAGCDALLDAVRCAQSRLRGVGLFQADGRHLPVRGTFDVIAALDVIEHLDDDSDALREMYSALGPEGGLVVTVPQHQWLWSAVDDFSHHRRRYSRRELIAKVRGAGFQILRCTSFFLSTLPFVVASRLLARRGRALDPVKELRIPRPLNAMLATWIRPEWWMIRAGASFPVGGSLLLVARRPRS